MLPTQMQRSKIAAEHPGDFWTPSIDDVSPHSGRFSSLMRFQLLSATKDRIEILQYRWQ
jgi:hypothetical protein